MRRVKLQTAGLAAMVAAVACAVHGPVVVNKPTLVLRANRLIALPGQGIMLTAAIEGPEAEAYYCPTVVWTWPNGTTSTEGGDCPPWETRGDAYPRIWRRGIQLAVPGKYEIEVRLERSGHVVARQVIELTAAGGEELP